MATHAGMAIIRGRLPFPILSSALAVVAALSIGLTCDMTCDISSRIFTSEKTVFGGTLDPSPAISGIIQING